MTNQKILNKLDELKELIINEKEEEIEVYTSAIENYKNNCQPIINKPLSHFFKPGIDEEYWYISGGEVFDTNNTTGRDAREISIGNCYRTREEAQLALDKQQALVRLWDWADENCYFRPDWENEEQRKYFVYYDYDMHELWNCLCFNEKYQNNLPYLKSTKDCENFIKNNKEDITLILK